MPAAKGPEGPIQIERLHRSKATITVEGTAPLIINQFSEKAKQMMLDKQMGRAVTREHKNPEENFEAARYRLPNGDDGIPSVCFKGAIVDAARYFGKAITMVSLKSNLFIPGVGSQMLLPIESGPPKMREDTVRNATGVADIRHRPEFDPWRVTMDVVFMPSFLSLESLLALVDASGNGGVGEWRPNSKESKTGQYGTYRLVDESDVKVVTL